MKPSVLLRALAPILGSVVFFALACASDEDTTATPVATGNRADSATTTVAPSPTPTETPSPVPTPTPTPAPVAIPVQVTLELDPSLTEQEVAYLTRAIGELFAEAEADFGVESPRMTIFAYRDQAVILGKRAAWEGITDTRSLGQQFTCDFCAETGFGAMFLRLGPGWFSHSRYPESHVGRAVLAGEVSIAFVFAALGEAIGYQESHTPPQLVRVSGPAWLGKGATTLWQTRTTSRLLGVPFERALGYATAKAKADPVAIEQMESPVGFRTGQHPYDTSLVAVEFLTRDTPAGSFMEFYAAIGRGQSWQSAFPAVFGVSLSDFYAKFAEYRAKLGPE